MAFVILSAEAGPLAAQENHAGYARNTVFVEGLGPGFLYSLNYDRLIMPDISVRVGFSSWSLPALFLLINGEIRIVDFPIMVNYLVGHDASRLELGIGLMPTFLSLHGEEIFLGSVVDGKAGMVFGTATVGFRYQPKEGGLIFRIGFTPVFTFKKFLPWAGVSLGAAF
jgi:hypothetical protein